LESKDGIPQAIIGNPAETAMRYFTESLHFNDNSRLTHANLCLLYATPYFRQKDPEIYLTKCRSHGEKAIEIKSDYINGYRDLALSLARYGEFDEAFDNYKKALEHAKTKKDLEIMDNAKEVLTKVGACEEEIKRWCNPPPDLLI
jgi:Tfp pilus assembly protein PilF